MKALKQGMLISTLTVAVLCAAWLAWRHWDQNTSRLVDGSEVAYVGIVHDRAMSSFENWHRAYISIQLEDGTVVLFWEERGRDSITEGNIGDLVRIESAIEEETDVLVALQVTVLEKKQTK